MYTNQGKRCLSDKKGINYQADGSWKEWEIKTKKSKRCYNQMSLHPTAELVRAFQAMKGKDSLPHLLGAASRPVGSVEKGNGDSG